MRSPPAGSKSLEDNHVALKATLLKYAGNLPRLREQASGSVLQLGNKKQATPGKSRRRLWWFVCLGGTAAPLVPTGVG